MMRWALALALLGMTFPTECTAQSKEALIGTWRLVSAKDITDKGEVQDAYGQNPTGFITYTADGRMMAIITNDGRKPLSTLDWLSAPVEERAEAFSTVLAYAGSYTSTGDRVIHHVEAAFAQNFVNTDLVRFIVKLEGSRVTLRTTPYVKRGVHVAYQDLVWERVRSTSQ